MIEPLAKSHKKEDFDCGDEALNDYLKKYANQDVNRNVSACHVFVEENKKIVMGYFTLSSDSIDLTNLPDDLKKKLPTYKSIPTILLGRLAVDNTMKGKGFGGLLLVEIFKMHLEMCKIGGAFAMVVDPIDDKAMKFYKKYGFQVLQKSKKMFITTKNIKGFLENLQPKN